jgi:signal transduction histidine kinase/CheY-like chemotaxis protein
MNAFPATQAYAASLAAPPPPAGLPGQKQGGPSELKRLEHAKLSLQKALDLVDECVLIVKPPQPGAEAYVMHGNTRACQVLGIDPRRGMHGMPLRDITADDAERASLEALMSASRAAGVPLSFICRFRTGDAPEPAVFQGRVRAMFSDDGDLWNHTICLSELRPAPENAVVAIAAEPPERQQERMHLANLAGLAKGMAHDVNNLLGPMLLEISNLLQSQALPDHVQPVIEKVYSMVKRAGGYTELVLNAARAKPMEKRPVDIAKLMRETATVCASGSDSVVEVRTAPGLKWVYGEPVQINQVLQNLMINGLQAMQPLGGRMFVEASNLTLESGNELRLFPGRYVDIRVRDRGAGMDRQTLARLFHDSFTTKTEGNGIGLVTCARFVRDHGGSITAASIPKQGSEFRVVLPAVEPAAGASGEDNCRPVPLVTGEGLVLLVDDEMALRQMSGCALKNCGYDVITCCNGEEAVAVYRQRLMAGAPPDVVLMDLTLPGGLSGTETAREILALHPGATLVVTSGSVTSDLLDLYLDMGFAGVLPKPYEAGTLSQKVREVLDAAQRRVRSW